MFLRMRSSVSTLISELNEFIPTIDICRCVGTVCSIYFKKKKNELYHNNVIVCKTQRIKAHIKNSDTGTRVLAYRSKKTKVENIRRQYDVKYGTVR